MFIKLFSTPNRYYCLDVNKNEFLELSFSAYQYLEQILNGQEVKQTAPEEILILKKAGYLSKESNVKQVKHAFTDYLENFLERKLSKITLQVTQNCNFRCKYCIYSEEHNFMQRSHSSKSMSWETAKDALIFLWKHSVDSSTINIGFYGGEPLLQMPLIEQVIEYSKKLFKGKKLTYNITTNGTLLDVEKILYLQKHDVSLMISLDGPREINDINRVFANGTGTYDTVMEKITLIREIAPEYAEKLSISMVMDPENDFDCINNICLREEDVDKLNIVPSIVDKDYDGEKTVSSDIYRWKYQYQGFLAILSFLGRYEKEKVSPIVLTSVRSEIEHRFDIENAAGLFEKDAPAGPCITGQMRLFSDVEGRLFPCERVSENSSAMCIGTIDSGFNINNAKELLNVGELTTDICKECWCFRYCTLCCKKADSGKEALDATVKLSYCSDSKRSAYHKIMLYLLFKEVNVDYLTQIKYKEQKGDR
ncbi:radical SAM protein [Anaerocolumna aminovalerica]|uniref:radical SAM protein n=1 Tax=Anaerocolumna aminovalerica TaxID=1527 RepID=UPI001C0F09D7|nr:radical SAM protein [Anaerocolumna aminovalerica]MBU5331792.1 radical SAM protein [Anaerocolumna aminovalerica]